VHLALGWVVVVGFGALWLWAMGAWIRRRREVHRWFWTLLGVLQATLIVQMIAGVVLLILGYRRPLLHYLYGSVFPVFVLVAAHVVARDLKDERAPYQVFGFATFIVFGLTLRALTTGLGIG